MILFQFLVMGTKVIINYLKGSTDLFCGTFCFYRIKWTAHWGGDLASYRLTNFLITSHETRALDADIKTTTFVTKKLPSSM